MRRAAPALAVALLAALAAAPRAATDLLRVDGPPVTDADVTADVHPIDLAEVPEMAEVPAWRELWYGSLEGLHIHREPTINNTQEDVLVQLGAVAFLHCPVRNLGERGVSWVRRRDWHIISSGVLMYTNDERFQVLHSEGSDDWILQIKYVQKRDNGTYECQGGRRSTSPPEQSTPRATSPLVTTTVATQSKRQAVSTASGTLSRLVHLHIAVPEAFILGADEHHVDAGSTINLVCIIEKSPVPPQYVFWYHNSRMINYDAARGVTVVTEPGPKTQSTLAIRAAGPRHSGNYTCCAANTEPAHIYVYVSEGSDKMAATLSRNAGGARALAGALPLAGALALAAAARLLARPGNTLSPVSL